VDFDHPERNQDGIMVLRAKEIVVDKDQLVDCLVIYKPIYDL